MLQEEVTELALYSLPDWFAVLLPVSSDGGSGGSAPGGSPAAGTEAAGVQEGLAAVVLRLHVGLAAFFSTYCDGPGPLHGKIFVTKKLATAAARSPEVMQAVIQGEGDRPLVVLCLPWRELLSA